MSDVTAPQVALKQPGESLVYSMDFVHLLFPGETIKSSPAPVVTQTKSGGGVSDLVIGSPSINGSVVSFRISGGTDGIDYTVQVLIETDFGTDDNIRIGDGILQVRNT